MYSVVPCVQFMFLPDVHGHVSCSSHNDSIDLCESVFLLARLTSVGVMLIRDQHLVDACYPLSIFMSVCLTMLA